MKSTTTSQLQYPVAQMKPFLFPASVEDAEDAEPPQRPPFGCRPDTPIAPPPPRQNYRRRHPRRTDNDDELPGSSQEDAPPPPPSPPPEWSPPAWFDPDQTMMRTLQAVQRQNLQLVHNRLHQSPRIGSAQTLFLICLHLQLHSNIRKPKHLVNSCA